MPRHRHPHLDVRSLLAASLLAACTLTACDRRAAPETATPPAQPTTDAGSAPVVTGQPASPDAATSSVTNSGGISSGMSGVHSEGPASGASR